MISDLGKEIYNTHLVVSRKIKDQPFRIRKNFDDITPDVEMNIQKLERLFTNHPNLNQEDFFEAPYKVFPDEDTYYSLEFYTKPRAIRAYTRYMKQLELQDPDSPDSLRRLANSLKFVARYCIENGLKLSDYELNTTGTVPCFVEHLKNHKINYFTLHALTFQKPRVESRILDFIFPDFFTVFQRTKNKFYASKVMKEFAKQAKQKLEQQITQ